MYRSHIIDIQTPKKYSQNNPHCSKKIKEIICPCLNKISNKPIPIRVINIQSHIIDIPENDYDSMRDMFLNTSLISYKN